MNREEFFMFVYSMRANTLKFIGIISVALVTLITLITLIPSYESEPPVNSSEVYAKDESINYEKIKTNEDRVNFLSQFGWQVNAEPEEVADVVIPAEFDKVFAGYNEIQKGQALDLSKYKKKSMSRYTYVVTNYPEYEGKVYANILVYRNKVVGGDICSANIDGFIHGFSYPGELGQS